MDGDTAADASAFDAGPCGVAIRRAVVASATHVDDDATIDSSANPPSGGDHYGRWVTWGAHDAPIAAGYWLHNLEHGGVAFLYRCATRAACATTAAKLEALVASLPQDPACAPPVRARALVLPEPSLPSDVEIAAVAWEWTLTAKCYDEAALRAFYTAHVAHGPEDVCAQGTVGADSGSD